MNFTVLSLVLAAAQPLLQAILSCNINEISVGNLKKAKFKLVHSLKGRRRYSSVLLKDVTFAFTLKEKLQKLDLFSSIEVNSFTGTVLFNYSCDDDKVDIVINHLNEEAKLSQMHSDALRQGTVNSAGNIGIGKGSDCACSNASGSYLGHTLRKYSSKANAYVKTSTNGIADLSILIGAFCLLWGIYKIRKNRQVPNSPQLLWWVSYSYIKCINCL